MRFVLASSSPARLATLRRAGIDPIVISPDVDEDAITAPSAVDLVAKLARAKAEAVLAQLPVDEVEPTVLVACDSLLELDGHTWGKPGSVEAAVERWKVLRRRQATLHTGHHVVVLRDGCPQAINRVASTLVTFADLDDVEIEAYGATGEPQKVAGSFTIDGIGGAFITGVSGDPHNVVGISLPVLRQVLLDLGVAWPQLWRPGLRP